MESLYSEDVFSLIKKKEKEKIHGFRKEKKKYKAKRKKKRKEMKKKKDTRLEK